MAVNVTMVDKNGNEWIAGDATEVNDLLAVGYVFKGHSPGEAAPPPNEPPKSATTKRGAG